MIKWPFYLNNHDIESQTFIRNSCELQNQWCLENDFESDEKDKEFSIIKEQVKRFQPNLLFIFGVSYYHDKHRLEQLLDQCPSIKIKASWYGAPEGNESKFKDYDLVLTNSIYLKVKLQSLGIKSEVLDHAFEVKTLEYLANIEKHNKAVFIGSVNKSNIGHKERTEIIEYLAQNISKFDILASIYQPAIKEILHYQILEARHEICKWFATLGLTNKKFNIWSDKSILPPNPIIFAKSLIKKLLNPAYGLDMFKIMSSYNISLNGHINITGQTACNMRLFESTGVGCCLLTDNMSDISKFFEPDHEILVYNSKEEALEKSKYLLDNPKEAKRIGQNGQQRTLSQHITEKQVAKLSVILKDI